ncbi:MAG: hypothetical protein AB7F86_01730 [Bdellovibrionales bacterium]
MTARICILLLALMTVNCSMITEPPTETENKACAGATPPSEINISIQSADPLPIYFGATVADSLILDECAPTSEDRFVFVRHNAHNATLTIFAVKGTPAYAKFFNADGTPITPATLKAVIVGRPACDSDNILISQIEKPLTWVPMASPPNCTVDGYSGF